MVQNENQNLKQNQVYTSIIVLDDGETWSGAGQILYLTANGYNRLLEGGEISDLAGSDIVKVSTI